MTRKKAPKFGGDVEITWIIGTILFWWLLFNATIENNRENN
ncbi:hypothetical protein KSC_031150 [Ktedonobacter sp. SOSP1-52]|nr:hypothetical protein KSC_031150 [Ktedonobacter sp. SOSP1-52]